MSEFVPQNILEEHLVKAPEDAGEKAEFFKALLTEPLIAPAYMEEGKGVAFPEWEVGGKPVVPMFTSKLRLDEALERSGIPTGDVLNLPGRELFEMVPEDVTISVNPGSKRGYTMPPKARADLLDGTLFKNLGTEGT